MSKASNHLSKSSQIKGPRHAVIKNVLKKRVKSRGSVSKARLQEVTAELDSEFVAAQNPYAVRSLMLFYGYFLHIQ